MSATALGAVLLVYAAAIRTKHHYASVLTCPLCKRTFEYDWVPLVSFTSVRLGHSRYLRCPLCHGWSTYNVWDTRKKDEPDPGQVSPSGTR